MVMGFRVFVASTVAVVAGQVLLQSGAAADCAGPAIRVDPMEVAAGAVVSVRGEFFGDDCVDQDPRPEGVHGTLGDPLTGVEVTIVQGDQRHLVAVGSADDDYEFDVDVIVPSSLTAGAAVVEASDGGAGNADLLASSELVVSDAEAAGAVEPSVASFGTSTGSEASDQEDGLRTWEVLAIAAAAVVAVVGLRAVTQRRRT